MLIEGSKLIVNSLDDKMNSLFLAVEQLDENEQTLIREMINGMIVKYEVRRLARAAG